ncbi:MAG: 23S rRNA (adenine(2503)-C(2))-methyltransferase RlmN [Bacteroidales bacterium]|nr:23S rRNA (adenine(2503)-C(2))-methyltransferase RlmN [Bacteroidales bacterium]
MISDFDTSRRLNLMGASLADLQALCDQEGFPKYTAKQLADWIYRKRAVSIDQMSNISLKARQRLHDVSYIGRSAPTQVQTSLDGTKKYLYSYGEGRVVESVFIPTERSDGGERGTLCISSQVGCRMGCRFCVTGQQGFRGNLSAGEILNQIFSLPEFDRLTNVVYMGMGEPLDNCDAVLQSLQALTETWGLAWSPTRITVSTVGVMPAVTRFVEQSRCHLAVSLHNAYGHERGELMPIEKSYSIEKVVDTLRRYDWDGQRRLSFEYIVFRGMNDDLTHAAELVRLLHGLKCRVNLIRFHTSPGMPFHTAGEPVMQRFRDYLLQHDILCTIRASRGEDIMAACGLLAGKAEGDATATTAAIAERPMPEAAPMGRGIRPNATRRPAAATSSERGRTRTSSNKDTYKYNKQR